ncbi:MAG TPA: 16S rRNA (guanine(966)-N(2))-methyltransferase RsmD [Acidimicrobiales bacterium]|nr:16S rRNA (guanine(966)-N(2))-methyltransferase RsmD [Acidimicrobiales bacterium]
MAGVARGRQLKAPAGSHTRPTSDRVREAMFSMLVSMDAVEGAAVVDLFAGSGALGIEALSRGAESVTFVDNDRTARDSISGNLTVLGELAGRAKVVAADSLRFASTMATADLVLADPPYDYTEWPALLEELIGRTRILVAETGDTWDPGPAWETVKVKKYGGTVVTVSLPALPPASQSTQARAPRPENN